MKLIPHLVVRVRKMQYQNSGQGHITLVLHMFYNFHKIFFAEYLVYGLTSMKLIPHGPYGKGDVVAE